MPNPSTVQRAKEDLREGKSPSTAAGEFVHEEIEHVRKGRHGVRSPQQAVAIGLSKARRAGIPLKLPAKGKTSAGTREKAKRDTAKGRSGVGRHPSRIRSQARKKAMKKEPKSTVSHRALAIASRTAAKRCSAGSRSAAARKAVRTKGPAARRRAAKKAARTRAR